MSLESFYSAFKVALQFALQGRRCNQPGQRTQNLLQLGFQRQLGLSSLDKSASSKNPYLRRASGSLETRTGVSSTTQKWQGRLRFFWEGKTRFVVPIELNAQLLPDSNMYSLKTVPAWCHPWQWAISVVICTNQPVKLYTPCEGKVCRLSSAEYDRLAQHCFTQRVLGEHDTQKNKNLKQEMYDEVVDWKPDPSYADNASMYACRSSASALSVNSIKSTRPQRRRGSTATLHTIVEDATPRITYESANPDRQVVNVLTATSVVKVFLLLYVFPVCRGTGGHTFRHLLFIMAANTPKDSIDLSSPALQQLWNDITTKVTPVWGSIKGMEGLPRFEESVAWRSDALGIQGIGGGNDDTSYPSVRTFMLLNARILQEFRDLPNLYRLPFPAAVSGPGMRFVDFRVVIVQAAIVGAGFSAFAGGSDDASYPAVLHRNLLEFRDLTNLRQGSDASYVTNLSEDLPDSLPASFCGLLRASW
ncbi:hypothetical protein EV421DRAFT_1952525 [Armillaria borealis]|uniref:Uncharacterized protein n=1 Tax=Armillaria borealis TaxID=47425 RepID=A0AA39MPX2_9AGAR|nr:hypothetical protein EV421DRAFT_1952525 [Armillaria borealis]